MLFFCPNCGNRLDDFDLVDMEMELTETEGEFDCPICFHGLSMVSSEA